MDSKRARKRAAADSWGSATLFAVVAAAVVEGVVDLSKPESILLLRMRLKGNMDAINEGRLVGGG